MKTQFDKPTTWKPKPDHMLLVPVQSEETSKGGIIIPDAVRKKLSSGYIAVIGSDVNMNRNPQDWFALGDEVFFEQHSETRLKLDDNDEEAYLVAADSVLLHKPAEKVVTSQTPLTVDVDAFLRDGKN